MNTLSVELATQILHVPGLGRGRGGAVGGKWRLRGQKGLILKKKKLMLYEKIPSSPFWKGIVGQRGKPGIMISLKNIEKG